MACADASHEKGVALVRLNGQVDRDAMKRAVEDEDYTVVSIDG